MPDIIDELLGLDDAALGAKFGFAQKLADAKADLQRIAKLSGKPRDDAADSIKRMLEPSVYPGEFKYIADSAERKANPKSAKDAVGCCSPCEMVDDD